MAVGLQIDLPLITGVYLRANMATIYHYQSCLQFKRNY